MKFLLVLIYNHYTVVRWETEIKTADTFVQKLWCACFLWGKKKSSSMTCCACHVTPSSPSSIRVSLFFKVLLSAVEQSVSTLLLFKIACHGYSSLTEPLETVVILPRYPSHIES